MWLYRGVQSAVFYYATCTPCANSVDRRKRMKDAARSRRENEKIDAVVTDQPRPFAQPTAFSTNQGWNEEIALGPGPPPRRHRNNHRRTDSWNTDARSLNASELELDRLQKKDKSVLKHQLGDRWNRMRYQREDEPLWGEEAEVKGSSVGLSGRGRADEDSSSKYYIARVPPVNDLHPPIVSGPKSKAETRWMLQPPPSAKVMAGKERFSSSSSSPTQGTRRTVPEKNATGPTSSSPQEPSHRSSRVPERKPKPSIRVTPSGYRGREPAGPDSRVPQLLPSASVYGRDESKFVIPESLHSPSDSSSPPSPTDSSPGVSLHSPDTPVSRPVSKALNDGDKVHRPQISKTLSTLQRDTTKVHCVHVEINDPHDDVALGHFEQIRPWRWSMDI